MAKKIIKIIKSNRIEEYLLESKATDIIIKMSKECSGGAVASIHFTNSIKANDTIIVATDISPDDFINLVENWIIHCHEYMDIKYIHICKHSGRWSESVLEFPI